MDDPDTLFDLELGQRAKSAGQRLAEYADRAWPWTGRAERAIRELAELGTPFTADDLIRKVGLPSSGPNNNNAVGSVFSSAAKRGLIERTGHYRQSRRALAHGRMIAVWVGTPAGGHW